MTDRPFVLIVDDDPAQESFALLLNRHGVDAEHSSPDEVSLDDLERASLLLIDEYLEEWPGREQVKDQPALYIRDGVALAAVLRAQLEHRGPKIADSVPSRTAVVLRTGHLGHLASGLPRHLWSPAAASRYDLEWVAEKSAEAIDLAAIAIAAASLPMDSAAPRPDPIPSELANIEADLLARAQQKWPDKSHHPMAHRGESESIHAAESGNTIFVSCDDDARRVAHSRGVHAETFVDVARRLTRTQNDVKPKRIVSELQTLARNGIDIGDVVQSVLDLRIAR